MVEGDAGKVGKIQVSKCREVEKLFDSVQSESPLPLIHYKEAQD